MTVGAGSFDLVSRSTSTSTQYQPQLLNASTAPMMLVLQMPQAPHLHQHTPLPSPAAPPIADPPSSKRPKLSLQISASSTPRSFAKSTTSLTLNTTRASPTNRNTFSNAYELPVLATAPPPSIITTTTSSSLSSSSSPKSSRSPSSRRLSGTIDLPYQQPLGVRGILRNSPLPHRHRSASSARNTRRMFAPIKTVTYATPLTSEIQTTKYVVSHSELILEEEEAEETTESVEVARVQLSSRNTDEESQRSSRQEDTPETPIHGRRKRRREWVWTLEPPREATSRDTASESEVSADGDEQD
ncbi:MAG: hypothetical protein M1827_005028 [Pycnora praestabilis]|nr:MAG: hypothetical protein M1827_005028 [Pycnora praestabilis]